MSMPGTDSKTEVEPVSEDTRLSIGSQIDWPLAASTAKRLVRSGPKTTAYTYEAAQAELGDAATRAEAPVREITGLADGLRIPTTRILDRPGWIDAASDSMRSMLGADAAGTDVGSHGLAAKFGGVQAGGLLAFLSTAILGQYDPFTPDPETGEPGVLMVVTPNIINVERQLKVVPSDFRLWVCLHEVTHRVQFSANPWLRDYMQDNVAVLTSETGESATEIVTRMTKALRGSEPREKGIIGAMQLLQSPAQFEAFQRMMVLGTLLEGHADHVMDAVGPAHVPSVARIRTAFDKRRKAPQNPVQRIIRALIGMDAKIAQYIRGKAFVDEVVETVGMDRFNTVWTSPDTMPLPDEIDTPQAWIRRVL
ncbi:MULTISPECIES: zinc-dependent metalloprotease [Gordonia]|uniref:Zinc-dependent metalloprotease n=1 Tax=Gordonia amicalis TaxID=89053 RepID=A0AAE4R216_9ACTN|nr:MULTISPECIES: zinc-dependent metalloprotease [Gordonia]ATD73251.1 hydrolase [Gordonia sp. 1D]MBA5847275.1 zinc-dependent metalloprotease [Gordonia amicalis]MCZ0914737.1 zinc-dependent metalloprotease [Gordonia amicalis]MDJ0452458.1 zinc-dependent metalloprotease [Gordonia amicalis]MDV6309464.1 zinc-dependent metalloprotease [Gordonia amicalis]